MAQSSFNEYIVSFLKEHIRTEKPTAQQEHEEQLANVMMLKALIDHLIMVKQGRNVRLKGRP